LSSNCKPAHSDCTAAKDRRSVVAKSTKGAGAATITAVGTAFDVRKTGDRVFVAVAEGVVQVVPQAADKLQLASNDPARSAAVLVGRNRVSAGHEVVVDESTPTARVRATDVKEVTAWQHGRLQYLGEPLKYVVADVNRYSSKEIVVRDPAVGELLVTGTVFENDVDGCLATLEVILPVEVIRDGGNVELMERT
jgi:transmembrane sensor